MKYKEFQNILNNKFGASRPADIAKEFNVTPQVVNAWRLRDQVPYKYVKILRKKINKLRIVNSKPEQNQFSGILSDKNDNTNISIILEFFHDLLLNKKIIIYSSFLVSLFFTVDTIYLAEHVYSSTSKLIPISNDQAQKISGLMSQLGISIGNSQTSMNLSSAQLVPEVLQCRRVLSKVVQRKFESKKYDSPQPLIALLYDFEEIPKKWSIKRIQKATTKLKRKININKSRKSPLLNLQVYANEAQLATDINRAIIEETQKFMSESKISTISEKKEFISNRIKEVKSDLSKAEDELKTFREKNRSLSFSPALVLQQERLTREVEVQTEVYITLKSQFEITQIEEVDEPKIIEVLDWPEKPLSRISPPKSTTSAFVGIIVGLIIGILIVIGKKLFFTYKYLIFK